MKNLALAIVATAMLGVASMFVDLQLFELGWKHDRTNTIVVLAGFIVPAFLVARAIPLPPLRRWQAIVALAGFALCAIKFRAWQLAPHIAQLPLSLKLAVVSIGVGLVLSLVALVRAE